MMTIRKTRYFFAALTFLMVFGALSQMTYALYPTTDPWPVWRYDNEHRAYTTSAVTSRNVTIWNTATYYPYDTPIVVDGMVIFGGTGPRMYALDETTGVELWRSFTLTGTPYAHPAYANGRIFVGTTSGYLYCINATNGAKIWENQLTSTGQIGGAPTVALDKVFVGTTDNYFYALDALTGQYGVWYFTAAGAIRTSPAVWGNMVYFGCDDGKVYALGTSDPAGFQLKWRYPTKGQVRSSPSVGAGKVFIGSYSTDHAVFALNATATNPNGQLIWKYTLDLGYDVSVSPAFYNNVVYFTHGSGKVYALNANAAPGNYTENQPGCKIWSQTIGGYYVGSYSVAIANDRILASNGDVLLYCLDRTDGHPIWFSRFSYSPAEPIVADGRVFVADYYAMHSIGDYYPPVTYYYTVIPPGAGGASFNIKLVIANATPSQTINTNLLVSYKKINYTATGIDGTLGMSNITLPDAMLGGPYTVRINGGLPPQPPTVVDNGTHSWIYFNYFQSINSIEITGTTTVPEFSPTVLAPIMIAMTLLAAALAKKKIPKK